MPDTTEYKAKKKNSYPRHFKVLWYYNGGKTEYMTFIRKSSNMD